MIRRLFCHRRLIYSDRSLSSINYIPSSLCVPISGISEIPPHGFRKTFISTILEETGDLRLAQALAGHSDPITTANYDHREIKKIRKATGGLNFSLTSNGDE